MAVAPELEFTADVQDTVVVVSGVEGATHTVIITTTLRLENEVVAEVEDRAEVDPDGDGIYRFELRVPEPGVVVKPGKWLVTALLPVGFGFVDGEVVFDEGEGGELDDEGVLSTPRESRPIRFWRGHIDPKLPLLWNLLK
jgi:hypothetical protein